MSKLGRIGTMISLCVETKSMFNHLRAEGMNMSESIREHIRFLYNTRIGIETKSHVEHHWDSLQEDKREYQEALIQIENQQERFLQNLPRNLALHEKSKTVLSNREKMRRGRFTQVKRYHEKWIKDPMEAFYSNEKEQMNEWAQGGWNELDWGPCPDFMTESGIEDILIELEELNRKMFIQRASVEQIELKLESEGSIPDLLIEENIMNNLLLEDGDS